MRVCYNIQNVKEQRQGEVEGQSIKRERKHPWLISDVGCSIDCKNRVNRSNQTSNIRKHSTHSLGNIRSRYSHSCRKSIIARMSQDNKAEGIQDTVASAQSNTQFPQCTCHTGVFLHRSSHRRRCCKLVGQLQCWLFQSPECVRVFVYHDQICTFCEAPGLIGTLIWDAISCCALRIHATGFFHSAVQSTRRFAGKQERLAGYVRVEQT